MLLLLQGAREGTGSTSSRGGWRVELGCAALGLTALGLFAPAAFGFSVCKRGAEPGVFLACLQSAGGSAGLSGSWSVLPQLPLL